MGLIDIDDVVGTVIYVSANGKYRGNIIIQDEIKPDSKEAIKKLKERIDHKNVGPIPNLLIRNLSHHIWTTDCHKVASTPFDVVWLACGLNSNTNGLIERLEYAYTQKSL